MDRETGGAFGGGGVGGKTQRAIKNPISRHRVITITKAQRFAPVLRVGFLRGLALLGAPGLERIPVVFLALGELDGRFVVFLVMKHHEDQ